MKIACLLAALVLTGCPPPVYFMYARPSEIAVQGTWTHSRSGFVFPETIGEFERSGITLFDIDTNDVAAGYNIRKEDKYITVTVYVTAVAKYQCSSTDTLTEVYDFAVREIRNAYRNVNTLMTGDALFQNTFNGKTAVLSYEIPDQPFVTQSEVHVFRINGWILKYRISYPLDQADYIKSEVQFLLSHIENGYQI